MSKRDTARQCADAMMRNDRASRALGIRVEIPEAGTATATMAVRGDMINGFGVMHGGLIFALADTAFAFACNAYDRQCVAASAQIEFLRPALEGDVLTATAGEDYRGRRNGYYTIGVRNQDDELVALFRGRCVSNEQSLLK